MNDINFKIVGLFSSNNGQFCYSHEVCGQHICVSDVLRLVKTVVDVVEVADESIKFVRIIDGMDACSVGFVP
jgi:hypothetical protein